MKNIATTEDIYALLFFAISRWEKIPMDIQQLFMERAEIIRAKEHEIIHESAELSTYDYFIVYGIMMCYIQEGDVKTVKWLRSSGDYVYSRDMNKSMMGVEFTEAGNILAAVTDVIAVKISHADLKWLEEKSPELRRLISLHLMMNNQVFLGRRAFESMDADERYQFIEDKMSFDLFLAPDVYISSFLDISLKAVAKLRTKYER